MIKFKRENVNNIVTRSSKNTEELPGLDSYQVGTIYVVLAETDEFEDGFLLAKCRAVNQASLDCVYLERCLAASDHEYMYRETCEVGKVAKESVHTSLISINLTDPVEKIYSVDRVEVEEVLFSINI